MKDLADSAFGIASGDPEGQAFCDFGFVLSFSFGDSDIGLLHAQPGA